MTYNKLNMMKNHEKQTYNEENKMKNKKGFTLAETLITLTILGVIATVIIPNIVKNYQKRMTITRLKMAYSMLDNMVQHSVIENGYPLSVNSSQDIYPIFHQYFGQYLNIAKDCGVFTDSPTIKARGCFKDNSFKDLSGAKSNMGGYNSDYFYQVLLKNGMGLATWAGYSTYNNGVIFAIDTDGPKRGQSKLGEDVFMFTYSSRCNNSKGTLLMGGVSPTSCKMPSRATLLNSCKQNGSSVNKVLVPGSTCSSLIINDGWKITDDYPWDYAHKKL